MPVDYPIMRWRHARNNDADQLADIAAYPVGSSFSSGPNHKFEVASSGCERAVISTSGSRRHEAHVIRWRLRSGLRASNHIDSRARTRGRKTERKERIDKRKGDPVAPERIQYGRPGLPESVALAHRAGTAAPRAQSSPGLPFGCRPASRP
jgi:hypothetical protein